MLQLLDLALQLLDLGLQLLDLVDQADTTLVLLLLKSADAISQLSRWPESCANAGKDAEAAATKAATARAPPSLL